MRRGYGRGLRDFLNFTVADAGRADADTTARALYQSPDGLQIQVPAALGYIVRVADAVPELWPPATDFTDLCHKTELS